jgi:hypothetical protein
VPLKRGRRKRSGDRHRGGYYAQRRAARRFVGVDGEGWGKNYALLADSGGFHVDNVNGLSSVQCLDFLSRLKERNGADAHFVGFALGYDINHWLRDFSNAALGELWTNGKVRWEDWWVEWAPKRWFHVKHLPTGRSVRIWDSYPFFQGSFLKACADWGVAVPAEVTEGKAARHDFGPDDLPRIIDYNRTELSTLVRLLDKLRAGMKDAGIPLGQWYGAGAAASKLLQINRLRETVYETPREMERAVLGAYFGGHIEAGHFGRFDGPIWNGDLNSAYPNAMTIIPDLSRGRWVRTSKFVEGAPFALYHVEWDHERGSPYYPLPWRDLDGAIFFPRVGRSWVWFPEIEACRRTGWGLKILEGWVWVPTEPLRFPYAFIGEKYAARLKAGKKSGAGLAIKLALNALYGKTAQREGHYGRPTYRQFEVAGWITSFVRAKLWVFASVNLGAVISFNTDGVFVRAAGPIAPNPTEELGDFSSTVYRSIEIAEAGVYRLERQDGTWENYGRGFGKTGVPWDEWKRAREEGRDDLSVRVERLFTLGDCIHFRRDKAWVDRDKWRSWATVEKKLAVKVPSRKRIGAEPFDPMFGVPAESAPHDPRRQIEELAET